MVLSEIAAQFVAWSQGLVATWGYLGIFFISFIGSATIILPIFPTFLVVFAFGPVFNPWLVGIFAGLGAAVGELVGYIIGRGGRKAISEKNRKWLDKTQKWTGKYGMFAVLVVFAATPLPDDVVGIFGGAIGYDLKKFFVASLIGKIIMNLALAWGGYFGINWVLSVLGGI